MKNSNIISLIGMTGCGKTSVGKILAKRISADFVDLDEEIVKRYGEIKEIFATKGEEEFRKIEYSVLSEIIQNSGEKYTVLSTGGGAPTYEPSRKLLKETTHTVWLRRGVETIPPQSPILTRPPINGSMENYRKLLGTRYPIYRKTAETTVYNTYPQKTAVTVAHKIKANLKNNKV